MIKIGFIGFGRFSQHRFKILQDYDDVKVIGFHDKNRDLEHNFDISSYESEDEIYQSADAVIISVPPKFAPDLCKKALMKGIHVFCEKPPAINIKQLAQLENCSNFGILAYGFNHRLHDSIIEIQSILNENEMGSLLWMRGRYGKEVDDSYKHTWRCNKDLNGGGILIDQGIHLLDIMNNFAGGFDNTQAMMSDTYLDIDKVEDNAFINLSSSKTKISASLHSTVTQWRYLFSLELFFEKGSVHLNGLRTSSGVYGDEVLTVKPDRGGKYKSSTKDYEKIYNVNNSWGRELRAFIESIKSNKKYPHASLEDAKVIMNLLHNIYDNTIWINH